MLSKYYGNEATRSIKKFDDIFSHVDRMHQSEIETHTQMHRQTSVHRATAKTALTKASRGNNVT